MKFTFAMITLLAACTTSAVANPTSNLQMREVSADRYETIKQSVARQAAGLEKRYALSERDNPCNGGYLDANSCISACAACGCTKGCEGFCSYAGYLQSCVESYECQCAG